MNLLRVAGATLNQTPLDFAGNRDRIRVLLEEAQALGVELLCLPELCITGYGCEDAFFSLSTAKKAEATLAELLPDTAGMTVVLGLPHFFHGAMYNCAVTVQDGVILGLNAKRVLPKEGVHYEPRWFRPWPFGKITETRLCGRAVPLGDVRYRLGTIGVAIEICEEAWDSVPAAAAHADAVDVILNPSASHFALGKYARREHLVANSSRSMQVLYVYANLVGLEAGRIIYDGGVLFAEGGEIVGRGPRFGFGDGGVAFRDVNPELSQMAKLRVKPVRSGGEPVAAYAELHLVEVAGRDPRALRAALPPTAPAKSTAAASGLGPRAPAVLPVLESAVDANVEFLQAELLGLFDYLRKAGAHGYVVSLSGGCDSACCAVLVAHMLAAAFAELGPEGLRRRLRLPFAVADTRGLISRMLTCVYQSTGNSGAVTLKAAAGVAAEIGAAFHHVDVQALVASYTASAEAVLGRTLHWAQDDLTLQNIQARVRAPLVWTVANAKNAILLTTSNRSEAAVGYATMDGDTAGGLAPLGGIDKHFLRQWLVWAETAAPTSGLGLGPLPSLSLVNKQAPTAELRPPGEHQQDEVDLMPYEVLERIERYMIHDRLGPDDILQTLVFDFPATPPAQLRVHLERFFGLWARNQWKRERYAPSFHLDDLSLDPKTWCRFPILSQPYRLD